MGQEDSTVTSLPSASAWGEDTDLNLDLDLGSGFDAAPESSTTTAVADTDMWGDLDFSKPGTKANKPKRAPKEKKKPLAIAAVSIDDNTNEASFDDFDSLAM